MVLPEYFDGETLDALAVSVCSNRADFICNIIGETCCRVGAERFLGFFRERSLFKEEFFQRRELGGASTVSFNDIWMKSKYKRVETRG